MPVTRSVSQIAQNKTVWLELAANGGNDTSGRVGDPGKPFATPNAAVAALFAATPPAGQIGLLVFGVGVFATLNLNTLGITTAVSLSIQGAGFMRSSFAITWSNGQRALTIQDVGFQSVNIQSISNVGLAPNPAGINQNGTNGGAAGSVTLYGCYVSTDIQCIGGSASQGGEAELNETNGGIGGQGGQVVLYYSRVDSAINVSGGFGGEPGNNIGGGAGVGGAGGNGGSITLNHSITGALFATGGGRGADADDGVGGQIVLYFSDNQNELDVSGGNAVGPAGTYEIWMSRQQFAPTGTGAAAVIHGSVVEGAFVADV